MVRCLIGMAVLIVSLAVITGTVTHKPAFFSVIQSNSMYPLLSRGDIVFVRPVHSSAVFRPGDIVLFKESTFFSSNQWIIHQIISGNDRDGYVTKGTANLRPDQEMKGFPAVMPNSIAGKVIAPGGIILKLPLLGFVFLWLNKVKDFILVLPLLSITVLLLLIIDAVMTKTGINKILSYKKNVLFGGGGLFLSLLIAAYTVSSSQLWFINHDFPDHTSLQKELGKIDNRWPFPLILAYHTSDPGLKVINPEETIPADHSVYPNLIIQAFQEGKESSYLWVATFLPLLPPHLIHDLTRISFSLALITVSLIPGLPLMLFPLMEKFFYKMK